MDILTFCLRRTDSTNSSFFDFIFLSQCVRWRDPLLVTGTEAPKGSGGNSADLNWKYLRFQFATLPCCQVTSQEKRLRITEEKIKGLEGDFDYIADQAGILFNTLLINFQIDLCRQLTHVMIALRSDDDAGYARHFLRCWGLRCCVLLLAPIFTFQGGSYRLSDASTASGSM